MLKPIKAREDLDPDLKIMAKQISLMETHHG